MKDPGELLAAAVGGSVYVAPVGTAQPTTEATSLNAAFRELGYITEDGVSLTPGKDTQDVMSWQSAYRTRRLTLRRTLQLGMALQQWNPHTVQLAFDGGVLDEVSSGHYSFELPQNDDDEVEKCMVIDFSDGDKDYRWVFPKVAVDSVGTITFKRTDISPLALTLSVVGTDSSAVGTFLTNDPAFTEAAGS